MSYNILAWVISSLSRLGWVSSFWWVIFKFLKYWISHFQVSLGWGLIFGWVIFKSLKTWMVMFKSPKFGWVIFKSLKDWMRSAFLMSHFQVSQDLDGHFQVSQVWINHFQVSRDLDEAWHPVFGFQNSKGFRKLKKRTWQESQVFWRLGWVVVCCFIAT